MQMDKVTKRKAKEYHQQIHPLLRNHTHLLSPIPTSIFINKSLFSTFSFLDQLRPSLYSPTLKERQTVPNPPCLHRRARTSSPLPLRPFFSFRLASHPSGTSRTRQKSKLWRDENPASQLTPSPSLSNHPTPPSPDPTCATPFYHQLFLKLITHWTRQLLPLPPPSCQKDTRGGWICREGGEGGNGGARGGRKGEKGGFECEFEQILKQFLKWSSIIKGEESSIQLIERMYPFYYPFENSFYGSPFAPYYSDPNALFQLYAHAQEARPEENIPKTEEVNTNYSTNDPKPAADPHPAPTHPHPRRSGFPDANSVRPTPERKTARTSRASSGMRSLVESKQAVPKFRYTHKNFESNIINKIFSFLWSEDKSRCFVMRIVGDRAKCSLYYDYIKIVRKYCKRYINKEYLLNLCEYSEEHIAYRIVVKQTEKLKYFSMAEFSTTIRKLILLYLRSVCATSILTSKKMRKDIWREHFEKMRNIRDFLFDHLSPEEYDERMSYSYDQIYRRKLHPTPTPN